MACQASPNRGLCFVLGPRDGGGGMRAKRGFRLSVIFGSPFTSSFPPENNVFGFGRMGGLGFGGGGGPPDHPPPPPPRRPGLAHSPTGYSRPGTVEKGGRDLAPDPTH